MNSIKRRTIKATRGHDVRIQYQSGRALFVSQGESLVFVEPEDIPAFLKAIDELRELMPKTATHDVARETASDNPPSAAP